MEKEIIKYFLPIEILEHFIITNVEDKEDARSKERFIQIDLEEKNIIPEGYEASQYESKGFLPRKLIQDFPIRGKAVYISIKRRLWRNKHDKNKVIHSDYSIIAEGSKITKELSDFLKRSR